MRNLCEKEKMKEITENILPVVPLKYMFHLKVSAFVIPLASPE